MNGFDKLKIERRKLKGTLHGGFVIFARDGEQAGRFIDDDEVIVFVQNLYLLAKCFGVSGFGCGFYFETL